MNTDDLRIRRWGEINDDYLGPAFHMRFKPGQVLYGSRRTYLRKVAVPDFEGVCANTTFVLGSKDPTVLLPELLPFIMQTEVFHEYSITNSKGSVNPYINFSDLTEYEFALPPLAEQRRIAEVLWAAEEAKSNYQELIATTRILWNATAAEYFSETGLAFDSGAKKGARLTFRKCFRLPVVKRQSHRRGCETEPAQGKGEMPARTDFSPLPLCG